MQKCPDAATVWPRAVLVLSEDDGEPAELPKYHGSGPNGPGRDAAHEAAGSGLRGRCGLLRGE